MYCCPSASPLSDAPAVLKVLKVLRLQQITCRKNMALSPLAYILPLCWVDVGLCLQT